MKEFQEKFALSAFQIGLISESTLHLSDSYSYIFHPATAAVLELGALGGALVSGAFADVWSRRKSISLACGKCHRIKPLSHLTVSKSSFVSAPSCKQLPTLPGHLALDAP